MLLEDNDLPKVLKISQFQGAILCCSQERNEAEYECWRNLKYDRPLNIHLGLKTQPLGQQFLVTGDYLYFHYM